ncbi:hypothetical protein K2Q00_03065 [Patescibacteria group bacterium]|nr:hypothetical protein [Patescibacteria group bacterium]
MLGKPAEATGVLSQIPNDFDMYGAKMEIWWLTRKLKGRTWLSSSVSWGEDGDLKVQYELDMRPDSEFRPEFKLSYSVDDRDGVSQDIHYSVYLDETPANYGGFRYWFFCPLSKDGKYRCNRRVAVLYFSGRYFGCRQCIGYEYDSKSINYSSTSHRYISILKMQDMSENLKRCTWRGKDTRQMKQFRKLCEQAGCPKYADALIRLRSRRKTLKVT